jgi:hypothetical protein
MAGLVPAIHAPTPHLCPAEIRSFDAWMAVTSTAMTFAERRRQTPHSTENAATDRALQAVNVP